MNNLRQTIFSNRLSFFDTRLMTMFHVRRRFLKEKMRPLYYVGIGMLIQKLVLIIVLIGFGEWKMTHRL